MREKQKNHLSKVSEIGDIAQNNKTVKRFTQ